MNIVVVEEVCGDLVAASAKHLDFKLEDHVLASALPVVVVNDEYFHGADGEMLR